jgi:hypothetical protein
MRRESLSKINIIVMLVVSVLISGCANNITVKKIGDITYPPLTPYESVLVFNNESEIKGPKEVLATIEFSNIGKYRRMELTDAIEPIKAEVRKIGANGIIIDKFETIHSGIASRGISVEARAIRQSSLIKPQENKLSQKERLRQLMDLRDSKMINEQEFEIKKKEILDTL